MDVPLDANSLERALRATGARLPPQPEIELLIVGGAASRLAAQTINGPYCPTQMRRWRGAFVTSRILKQ